MAKTKKSKGAPAGTKLIAGNRVARRNYDITDTYEAGLVLLGSEVKSMREVLENTETTLATTKQVSERSLVESGRAVEEHEQNLLARAATYCEALRPRPELGDLFQQLEAQQ